MLKEIEDTILLIQENPELFHDGIDYEIIALLKKIKKYIETKGRI